MRNLRLAGVIRESIVDGPGIRFVVFAQGCPHHCPECHNSTTWDFAGGFETAPEKVIAQVKTNPLLAGITLSGGEPFCQAEAMAETARLAHEAGLNVWVFTGYLFEQLLTMAQTDTNVDALLRQADVLVDGPFIQKLKSYELKFKGSSNQRTIDVKRSLAAGHVVEAEL